MTLRHPLHRTTLPLIAIASAAAAAAAIGPIRRLWSQGESLAQPSIDRRRQNGRKVQKRKTKGASSHFPRLYIREKKKILYTSNFPTHRRFRKGLSSHGPSVPPPFYLQWHWGPLRSAERETQPHSFLPAALTSNPHFPRIGGGGGGGGRKGKMVRGAAWESYHRVREAEALCAQNGIHHY